MQINSGRIQEANDTNSAKFVDAARTNYECQKDLQSVIGIVSSAVVCRYF
jgi:hypothetical protein